MTTPALSFEGYAIVSDDGMLADASGVMPPSLKFPGDQLFFERSLDAVDLIVHGRNSYEDQPRSRERRRIIVTRQVTQPQADPANPKAVLWNPTHAPFTEAAGRAGVSAGRVAIIGGTLVFDMFLDRYATFWLSVAPHVRLPGGVPVFSGIPPLKAQDVLRRNGYEPRETRLIDPSGDVTVAGWRKARSV